MLHILIRIPFLLCLSPHGQAICLSCVKKMSPSRESFVESRLAALELQMVEVLARPTMPIADNARLDNVSYSSRIKYGTASKPEPNNGHHVQHVVPPASPPDHESRYSVPGLE